MKPEAKFWQQLKKATPEIHWFRIESFSSPGIPDLYGIFQNKKGKTITFWVELKCSEMKKVRLSPKQISWNYTHSKLGGINYIMVQALSDSSVHIYPGSEVRELCIKGLAHPPLLHCPSEHQVMHLFQQLAS